MRKNGPSIGFVSLLRPGDFVQILIEKAEDYDLRGVVIDACPHQRQQRSAQPTPAHNSI
ncbi:MAG: hypothetical protein ACREX4_20790 [Gammaproteobacteria bacterium]